MPWNRDKKHFPNRIFFGETSFIDSKSRLLLDSMILKIGRLAELERKTDRISSLLLVEFLVVEFGEKDLW